MQRFPLALVLCLAFISSATAQSSLAKGWWRASLLREDGNHIVFNFELKYEKGKPVWYIRNASERIPVTNLQWKGDSLIVRMPVFESTFYLKRENDKTLRGKWVRGGTVSELILPVEMVQGPQQRFSPSKTSTYNISGRWAVTFTNDRRSRPAIGEFKQTGNSLTGTFLNPAGDYRFLEGTVDGDTLRISTFDGHHAYYFKAKVNDANTITSGSYVSGPSFLETWKAVRDEDAILPDTLSAVYLKPGEDRLNFRFPDLDSNLVSINDNRFRNKVVVIQLMGSWCANCMDETAFLSDFYDKNRQRGIEVVSLAYEYSTDFHRSRNSLKKFQQRFAVKYPMLITGVRTSDSLRTKKTLPQITTIKMLPTTLFIGKDGKVKSIHTGFNGPGTGAHYELFKREFYDIIEELLKQ